MTHDELKALLPLAALRRLDPGEEASLREHLAGCAECEAELREFENALAMLAIAGDAPPRMEDRVRRKLEARLAPPAAVAAPATPDRPSSRIAEPSRRGATRTGRSLATRVSIAAAIVLALYGAGVTARMLSLQHANDERANQLAYLQTRFTTLEHEAQQAEQRMDALSKVLSERVRLEQVLDAPDLQITLMIPLAPAPGAHGLIAVSRTSGDAVLRASGLSAAPQGKIYELWWITKRMGPVPGGTFTPDADRDVVAKVDPPPPGDHVMLTAVTLEPAGGMPKPTGVMYLKGSPERE